MGLMAYVLLARDRCTPSDCAAFRSLTNRQQLVSNMDERVYDGLVMRYSASWNAPPPMAAAAPVAALAPIDAHRQADQCRISVGGLDPAGQHHDARAGHRGSRRRARRRWRMRRRRQRARAATTTATAPAAPAAAKKQPAPKAARAAPVQLAPAAAAAARPAATNE